MVNRVTSQTMMAGAQRNLQSSAAQLARVQAIASSQQRIGKPSDDPTGTAGSLRVRVDQAATAQYGRNIDDGNAWLTTIDSTLSSTTDILRRVRHLTVQGANDGALPPAAKEAIAKELEGLRSDLLGQANTTYAGRTVFAGTSDAGVAFQPNLMFTGTGAPVTRRLDASTTVRVDADGASVFGTGANSVFTLVDTIVADLRSGVNVASQLGNIDDRMNAVLSQQSSIGATQAQVLKAEATNLQQSNALEAQRSSIEDVDLSQVVLQLKQQEVTYQAALAVTSRTLQPTLMDFLH